MRVFKTPKSEMSKPKKPHVNNLTMKSFKSAIMDQIKIII